MANHVNSTASKPNKGFSIPHAICFRALDGIDSALIDLNSTLAATYRLFDAEAEDDPTRSLSSSAMERHLDGDMKAVRRAFEKAHKEILKHAADWRPKSNDGGSK
jgi:hypothetical protein